MSLSGLTPALPQCKPPVPDKPVHCCDLCPPLLEQMGLDGYVKRVVRRFSCQICAGATAEPWTRKSVSPTPSAAHQHVERGVLSQWTRNDHDETTKSDEGEGQEERSGMQDQVFAPTIQFREKLVLCSHLTSSPQSKPLRPDSSPPPLPPRAPFLQFESRNCSATSPHQGVTRKFSVKENIKDNNRPVAVRRTSTDWDSQLQNEPLYQTYRNKVITEEIKRQTKCHPNSVTVDDPLEWGAGGGAGTLWQELPAVQLSGVLERLSPAERKHQESMFEVLTSEASYLRSLRVLTEHFLESRDLDETLIIRDKKTLFSNILRVQEVSEKFLKDLEDRVDESPVISDICDIISYHAQHNFPAYIDYVRNQAYQEKTYSTLIQSNAQFATVILRLQDAPCCQRLPFMSFLLLPFQRITRIKMLTENILKRTLEGSQQERTASEALSCVSRIVKECNTQVGKMKQMEELIHMAKMLDFKKLRAVPVISQARYLEKRGELQELSRGGTVFSLCSKFVSIYLFLFNDLVIIANRKSNSSNCYTVIDHAHRSLVQVEPVTKDAHGSLFRKSFFLILLENHKGQTSKRFLKAPTESDMQRWMEVFPSCNMPKDAVDEVVYEDWDCPQVQCVEQYVAKQTDELNLDPADIINVLRKTNEGWYKGIRISDGETGWFPAANVKEITNEHVRRRNLRQQYRIARATANVVNVQNAAL